MIAWDHAVNRAWAISTGYPELEAQKRRETAAKRLHAVLQPRPHTPRPKPQAERAVNSAPQFPLPGQPRVTSNFDREGYLTAVRRAIEYVNAGDCFQVNLSQRLLAPLDEDPVDLYGRLRERNPRRSPPTWIWAISRLPVLRPSDFCA